MYRFLGLRGASVQESMGARERRAAYAADVTYTTAKQAGFDFLRMYLCRDPGEQVHRPFHYVIVDEAVRVGDMLYLSGHLGNVPGTMELVPGGIKAETRQTMEHIRRVLERHGSSLDRVAQCTVMMADMNEWPAMNAVYRTFFTDHFPARSAFGVTGLALGARVEIECIATVGGR